MAIVGGQQPGRNEMCPCGSGLKVKRCHGDPVLKQAAARISNHMMLLFITERLHETGVAGPVEIEQTIKKLVESADRMLPDSVRLTTNYEIQEGEAETLVDKLAEKEDGVLERIQEDTYLCGCGRRLPTGMKCAKCEGNEDGK